MMGLADEIIEYVPHLRRYARALIRNRELADDLVQDTLERALRYAGLFAIGTDLRAWLFTIMHNVFVGQVRKRSALALHVPVDDESLLESEFATQDENLRRLELRDVSDALQQLPAGQREVVLLVGLEDMSYADVALALDIPVGTVMSRLSRGRQRLRELMDGAKPKELPQTTSLAPFRQPASERCGRSRMPDKPTAFDNFALPEKRVAASREAALTSRT
jgi:RNA polymerase sigma-70 factor (ECF subfamily)